MVDGSTGVIPLVAALAKAYQAQHPGVLIDIGKGLGTKARIQAVQEGTIDIAMASHGLDIVQIERSGMVVHEIGKTAVVFGVNAADAVTDLSEAQICGIYAAKIQNWKELGGPDRAISPLTRPDSEVDTEVAKARIPCLANLAMPQAVKVMQKSGDMAQALGSTTGAIGMTTMTVIEQSRGALRPLAVRGIAPTQENVEARTYTLTRDSYLVAKAVPSAATASFLGFIRSAEGARTIAANGAVPAR